MNVTTLPCERTAADAIRRAATGTRFRVKVFGSPEPLDRHAALARVAEGFALGLRAAMVATREPGRSPVLSVSFREA